VMTFESTTISRISWTRPRSVEMPPNVLRFSCRRGAPHQNALKYQRSRAPKAVSCKRVLAGNLMHVLHRERDDGVFQLW